MTAKATPGPDAASGARRRGWNPFLGQQTAGDYARARPDYHYRDDAGIIGTALAARALACDPSRGTPPDRTVPDSPHPRYRCGREEYLSRHALVHYPPPTAEPAGDRRR